MHPEGGRRPCCSAKYNQHPSCVAKNIPNFYRDFTSERWTLMELRRLDNVLVWQSEFRCPCPDFKDLTIEIGLEHRSRTSYNIFIISFRIKGEFPTVTLSLPQSEGII